MVRRRLSLRLVALCLTLGIAALPTSAGASGFQLVEQNASGLGNAYAGQAAGVEDASAIFFNPAALTKVKGWNIALSVEGIGVNTTFADTGSTAPYVNVPTAVSPTGKVPFGTVGGNGGNAGKWIPVPSGYVSKDITSRISAGVSFNVPFGLETDWDPTWVGRFHATKSKVQAWNLNPTVAVKVMDNLSLGVGLDYQHLTADLNSTVAYGGAAWAKALAAGGAAAGNQVLALLGGQAGLARESPVTISGTSNGWGWNAGALFTVAEKVNLGFSYRSKVKHDVTGDLTFVDTTIPTPLRTSFANGPVKTTIELPDTFSAAASWKSDKLKVMADWTYTHWSTIQALDIERDDAAAALVSSVPLNFRNTWRAGLGANYDLNDAFTLRVGTAYDKSPVKDEFRTPRLPDNNRVWAAAGFQWRYGKNVRVDLGYAHLFVKDASSNLTNQTPERATPQGNLVGSYSTKVDIVGLQATLVF